MRRLASLLPLLLTMAWVLLATREPVPSPAVLDEAAFVPVHAPVPTALAAPTSVDELRARIAAVLEQEQVPGVGLALVDREGVQWAGGVGVADLQTRAPVTERTVFRVASITKSIVGLGVARLWSRGSLSLDEPLSQLLPRLRIDNPWAAESPVTVAHALEHTAGFDDMRFNETFIDDDHMTPAQALAINPRSRTVRWRPGSRLSYSNVGYTVAALAIEQVTKEPFDVWLHQQVLVPLGMRDAAFHRTPDRQARLATGYLGPERAAEFLPIAHRPAGSLLATPAEMARWVHYWLTRGQEYPEVAPLSALDRIERSMTHDGPQTDMAYGLGNYGDIAHPALGRGHDGGLPGFLSCYRYFPELGVGYVMLLNSTHSQAAYVRIRGLLFAYLTRGMPMPEFPSTPPEPDRNAAAGYYGYASPRGALFGFLDRAMVGWGLHPSAGGVWVTPLMGGSVELHPTGDGGYRHPAHSGTSLRVGVDRDGERVMTLGWSHGERRSLLVATVRLWVLGCVGLLLQFAPVAAVLWLIQRLVRRRGLAGAGLWLWPAMAGLTMMAMPILLGEGHMRGVLGTLNPVTAGLCALTLTFALASAFGLASAVRAAMGRERVGWIWRLWPTLTSTGAVVMTLWLGAHGIIGLRTWAW